MSSAIPRGSLLQAAVSIFPAWPAATKLTAPRGSTMVQRMVGNGIWGNMRLTQAFSKRLDLYGTMGNGCPAHASTGDNT